LIKLAYFLRPYKKECILGPVFKLFEAILELILPTIMALIINNGVVSRDRDYIYKMGALMLLMTILGFLSASVCQYMGSKASQGFGTNLRNKLMEHILGFSHLEMDKFGSASLINRVTNDVNQLQFAVAMLIRLVIRAPFILFGAVIMAVILDFKLSIILIATIPFFIVILYFYIRKTSPMYKVYQSKLDKLTLRISESLGGVRVIRAFAKTKEEEKKFGSDNAELTFYALNVARVSALLNPLTAFVINFAIIILLWVGAIHINSGRLSAGTIIAFINYVTQISYALIIVSNLIVIFTKAQASAKRVSEVLETQASIKGAQNTIAENVNLKDEIIRFKEVSFSYDKSSDMALSDIDIVINKGETIGIVGGTGSGKTTFINLIDRFYDVDAGEVLIQGINVKNYNLQELRNKVSIVPQSIELFNGTIRENILWGNENAKEEQIINAAKLAQADEFISRLKEGYQTLVSRGGKNFSGGQRQRLTIARAIVKNSDILILDDSSSALDFATDAALRKAIKDNLKDKTIMIVSQRASSVKEADKIVVFDDGTVVGFDKHSQLLKTCEVYREICSSQIEEKEGCING
jgi:ATP-binding cassette subfamily B protein